MRIILEIPHQFKPRAYPVVDGLMLGLAYAAGFDGEGVDDAIEYLFRDLHAGYVFDDLDEFLRFSATYRGHQYAAVQSLAADVWRLR